MQLTEEQIRREAAECDARKGERLNFDYISGWCAKHGTLDILAKAREEAGV